MVESSSSGEHWFQFFPTNYMWSHSMTLGFGLAGWRAAEFGEVERIGRRLKTRLDEENAWFEEWEKMAKEVEEKARDAEKKGHGVTARDAYLRAATYYFFAERFLSSFDEKKVASYKKCLDCFSKGGPSAFPGLEKVDIPYESSHLSAYYRPPENGAAAPYPTVVFFDGLDICKEVTVHFSRELSRRGVAVLNVDGPGQGETLRMQKIPSRHDYEVAAGAAVDYLGGRADVDSARLGIMAVSMGGYYAPRVAAFEKRFKACVAWGAHFDYHALWEERWKHMQKGGKKISAPRDHLPWVLGAKDMDEAMEKLRLFTLKGVAEKIECPILICHGEHDTIVPVESARQLFEATGSKQKELKIFTSKEGGAEHVMLDAIQMGSTYIADWWVDHL